ncbi:hypothetical protein PISL3812_06614 [Talaromyces islandicus]|uniref:Uncharacterized protein n=1 Tax=Talaromyces islandicus TaxID=28573 RepID=A0A0U1M1W9_TALIS|nr:hypothetical protein PISL3812_06614 [Talaromyces islandicus]
MAPVDLDDHVGARPNPLYNKDSLMRLFTFQHSDNAQDGVIRAGHQRHPEPKPPVTLKCDVALGCGSQESRSYKARLSAAESRRERFDRDSRIHASRSSKQKQARSYDTDQEEYEYENELKNENEHEDEDEIVYRVCQYSTGSRYGYLIDHCPEPLQSVPPSPHFISRARQIHEHHTKPLGVRVNLTAGTITLALVLLLLVAIMLVEIVDIICEARRSLSPEGERRGRTRARRALAQAFGTPRKLFVDNPEKDTIKLDVSLER